jgi:hypothetical protein
MNKRQRKQIDSIYRQSEFNLKLALTNIVALCASDEEKVNEIHAFLFRHERISLTPTVRFIKEFTGGMARENQT